MSFIFNFIFTNMRNRSIDELSEQIYSAKTREYFDEVIQSYYVGNYRSATVMLYSVVICDIVYKLNELIERYTDSVASKIISEIKKIQAENPRSSEWERILIDKTHANTQLLDIVEYTNLQALQHHRNLSAHPVLKESMDLFRPNKETVQAHIINMLEGVLTKPALMTRKIFDTFIEDLAEIKSIIIDDTKIEQYILSKYLNRIRLDIEYSFFKSLWKLVFILDNEKCNENREINLKVLSIILRRHYTNITARMKNDQEYYSNIKLTIKDCLENLAKFFNNYPKTYASLSDDCKVRIEESINANDNAQCIAFFLQKTLRTHLDAIIQNDWYLSACNIAYLYECIITEYSEIEALDFVIEIFSRSSNFDSADTRYDRFIAPNIDKFNENQLTKIVSAIHNNGQIHNRRNARRTNNQIKNRIKALGIHIDWTQYPYFQVDS